MASCNCFSSSNLPAVVKAHRGGAFWTSRRLIEDFENIPAKEFRDEIITQRQLFCSGKTDGDRQIAHWHGRPHGHNLSENALEL